MIAICKAAPRCRFIFSFNTYPDLTANVIPSVVTNAICSILSPLTHQYMLFSFPHNNFVV